MVSACTAYYDHRAKATVLMRPEPVLNREKEVPYIREIEVLG